MKIIKDSLWYSIMTRAHLAHFAKTLYKLSFIVGLQTYITYNNTNNTQLA